MAINTMNCFTLSLLPELYQRKGGIPPPAPRQTVSPSVPSRGCGRSVEAERVFHPGFGRVREPLRGVFEAEHHRGNRYTENYGAE